MVNSNSRVIQVDLNPDGSLVYTEKSTGDAQAKRSHQDAGEVFQWTSNAGSLGITFTGAHPFDQNPITAEAGQLTPPVRVPKGAQVGTYKYDVTLTDKNGVKHHEDPVIVIHADEEFATASASAGSVDSGLET